MGLRWVTAAGVCLLLAPAAQACSLAFMPFASATWAPDLYYTDGDSLLHVEGTSESTVAEGYFLSYAASDGGVLVAGQHGLGGDCSGTTWLRFYQDGVATWERSGKATVFPDEDGPLVVLDGKVWRWTGSDLAATPNRVPTNAYVQGMTADDQLVYRDADGDGIVVGGSLVPISSSSAFAVAHNSTRTAIAIEGDDGARLVLVSADGSTTTTSWAGERQTNGVAWTGDAWLVASAGRAFRVLDGQVQDLGVEALAVASRGPQGVAFQQDGYVVFDGAKAVESWRRDSAGHWSAEAPHATPKTATASSTSGLAERAPPAPSPGHGWGKDIPGPSAACLAAALLAGLAARRRASFEGCPKSAL